MTNFKFNHKESKIWQLMEYNYKLTNPLPFDKPLFYGGKWREMDPASGKFNLSGKLLRLFELDNEINYRDGL